MAISRPRWGARGTVPIDDAPKRELYVHHTVSAPGKLRWTRKEEQRHMREIEAQHISQGWNTIGYSYVLFPTGRLYVGRGFRGLPAAQGGHNTGTIAVANVGNYEVQKPTKRQKIRLVTVGIRMKVRGVRTAHGHREAPGQSTACPGSNLMRFMPTLRRCTGLRR